MMNPLPIITNVDRLREKCYDVEGLAEANQIIKLLTATVEDAGGVGLSAIQIGISKRIAVIYGRNEEIIPLINPTIDEQDEEFIFQGEGCLSLPDLRLDTKRFRHFVITNHIIEGNEFAPQQLYFYHSGIKGDVNNDGITAIAAQHEIDHMDGLLITDRQISVANVGRNDPCPCGKKKPDGAPMKYKKCCGKN